jgi:hypothetical protein
MNTAPMLIGRRELDQHIKEVVERRALEAKDPYLRGHSARVADLSGDRAGMGGREPIKRAHHERPQAHRLPALTRDRTEPNLAHRRRGRG